MDARKRSTTRPGPALGRGFCRGLAVALLAGLVGCGGDEPEPADRPEPRPEPRAEADRPRSARELALLGELRARAERRGEDELAGDAEEITRLEQALAREMLGEPPMDPAPREQPRDPGPRSFEPGSFPQLQEPDEERRADAVFDADPDDDVEMLVVAIQDESPEVREAAAEQLGDSEQDLALDALIGALQDQNEDVVMAAIAAIEWRDDARAIPALRSAAEELPWEDAREAARDAIDWLETD